MLNREGGFTLIEVVIVMAISASLAIIVLLGQAELRRRAQFAAAVEQVRNELVKVRNESNTTVNAVSPTNLSPGTNADKFIFGRRVLFNKNSGNIDVFLLIGDSEQPDNPSLFLMPVLDYSITIPYQVIYKSTADSSIVFTRRLSDGQLITYTPTDPSFNILNPRDYVLNKTPDPANNPDRQVISLPISDEFGHAARIIVDPENGSITREND